MLASRIDDGQQYVLEVGDDTMVASGDHANDVYDICNCASEGIGESH